MTWQGLEYIVTRTMTALAVGTISERMETKEMKNNDHMRPVGMELA